MLLLSVLSVDSSTIEECRDFPCSEVHILLGEMPVSGVRLASLASLIVHFVCTELHSAHGMSEEISKLLLCALPQLYKRAELPRTLHVPARLTFQLLSHGE